MGHTTWFLLSKYSKNARDFFLPVFRYAQNIIASQGMPKTYPYQYSAIAADRHICHLEG
jgi:hypothetical protein